MRLTEVGLVADWEDLALPSAQLDILRNVEAMVRNRITRYEEWSFGVEGDQASTLILLFSGPAGTVKNKAARILAKNLGLDLYRIDLRAVVNKYIDETEKNLQRIFDAAEHAPSILLFDESEALFGKRREISDSHDRYANIGIANLLRRMEKYHGVAILAVNDESALDPDFVRRFCFVVHFPF